MKPYSKWLSLYGFVAALHIAVLAAVSCPVAASEVLSSDDYDASVQALYRKCELGSAEGMKPLNGIDRTEITGWTGGCVDGLRDGPGALAIHVTVRNDSINLTMNYNLQGSFVRGKMVGLWCTDVSSRSRPELPFESEPMGCLLNTAAGDSYVGLHRYRRQDDGRWREFDGFPGKPIEPAIFLPAGSLEHASETIVAEARAGKTSPSVKLEASSDVLDGLVRGNRINLRLSNTPLDLKGKRVALVMSSNTLLELARFRQMRQAFIATRGSGGEFKDRMSQFVAQSDPNVLLAAISSSLHKLSATVVAGDDLSVLRDGSADYVLVLDWRFTGNFAITRKQYRKLPPCASKGANGCTELFHETVSAWLVDPALTAVKSIALPGASVDNSGGDTESHDGLLFDLQFSFEWLWSIDSGHVTQVLIFWLSQ